MASANPLEDQITCSVCLEVYRDPHVLRECFHTFCMPCINQLEERGKVPCPECRTVTDRKHVKKDFKIQGVIDALNQHQEDFKSLVSSNECGICHEPGKPFKYHCPQCEFFLCMKCEKAHKGMKVCKTHTVKPINKIMKASEGQFKELIIELEREKKNIHQVSKNIDKDIEEVIQCKRRQIKQVKQFTEDSIKELRENEKQLEKMIQDANASFVRNLRQSKQLYSKGQGEIQTKINFLSDLIKEKDLNKLMESTEHIRITMKESIQKIKSSLPDVQSNVKSSVSLKKGENWDVKGCIEIKVDQVVCDSQTIKPVLQSLYSDLGRKQFIQNDSVKLDHWPLKLCQINHDVWCAGNDKIRVYNQQCQPVKIITHDITGDIHGLTQTHNNQVIVACYKGLHQLDTSGQYQKQVMEGQFSDLYVYSQQLYALECNKCKIMVFKYSNKWVKSKEIKLGYTGGTSYDKLCVNKDNIYFSSWNNSCIYICNSQGQVQQEINQGGNVLSVCGVDNTGNLLVADYDSKEIKVYEREAGRWFFSRELQENQYQPWWMMKETFGWEHSTLSACLDIQQQISNTVRVVTI